MTQRVITSARRILGLFPVEALRKQGEYMIMTEKQRPAQTQGNRPGLQTKMTPQPSSWHARIPPTMTGQALHPNGGTIVNG
jgi:hypothetical protein